MLGFGMIMIIGGTLGGAVFIFREFSGLFGIISAAMVAVGVYTVEKYFNKKLP